MFAEAARQGMPAIAMSDHGNMFGAYEFQQVAKGFDGVKPIIGIEAYVAPSGRRNRKQEFWGPGGQRAMPDDGNGSKDVPGRYDIPRVHLSPAVPTAAVGAYQTPPPKTRILRLGRRPVR
jgi:hypothetical protein